MSAIVPRIFDEPPPPSDAKAATEALLISSGKLRRDESFRAHMHIGSLILFWFAIAGIVVTTCVWLFNVLTPTKWHFLDDAQKAQVQSLIIAALGSSLATDYGKRMLNRIQDQ